MEEKSEKMKQGTKIITLDNGYHLWTCTVDQGDHILIYIP